jgi:hypothetical protein
MPSKPEQIKYIIHHAAPGLGDDLITLCAAYDYAMQYKIPLIIDWRNSRWLSHKRKNAGSPKEIHNLFEILFDNRNTLGNIDIITDPTQIHEIIPNEELIDIVNVPQPLTGEIKKLYADGLEEILPRNYDSEIKHERMTLIRSLRISRLYASKVDDFLKKYYKKDIAAINIRLGNGEFGKIEKADMLQAAAEAHKIIKSIGCITSERYYPYAVSDTPETVDYIKKRFKKYEVINYPGMRPPQSTTASHMYVNADTPQDEAAAILESSFVDMLILSKAKHLILVNVGSNLSGYIYYARNFIPAENCYFLNGFRPNHSFGDVLKKPITRILKGILLRANIKNRKTRIALDYFKSCIRHRTFSFWKPFLKEERELMKRYKNKKACLITADGNNNAGFFSLFLRTLGQLYVCEKNGVAPVVYWGRITIFWTAEGCRGSKNAWEYYFKPVSSLSITDVVNADGSSCEEDSAKLRVPEDALIANEYFHSVIPIVSFIDESMRKPMNEIIKKYVRIRDDIMSEINGFYDRCFHGKRVLGLFFRAEKLKAIEVEDRFLGFLTLQYYFKEVNRYLASNPSAAIFVSTDSEAIYHQIKNRYGDRVFSHSASRTSDGEKNIDSLLWPKIGEDVLIDCVLLSKCDCLIHGISNISTAACFFNPDLKQLDVYKKYRATAFIKWFQSA